METREYRIRGDPSDMLRALRSALPLGASLSGNTSHGSVSALFTGKVVEYWRNGVLLKVTVYGPAPGRSEAEIWSLIERGLSAYI